MSRKLTSVFIIPQGGIKKFKLPYDFKLWILMSHIRFWSTKDKSKSKIINGEKYIWINYPRLLELFPILGISDRNALTPKFKRLESLGLIERYQAKDNSLYVAFTKFAKKVYECDGHIENNETNNEKYLIKNKDTYPMEPRQTYLMKPRQHNKYSNKNKNILKNGSALVGIDNIQIPKNSIQSTSTKKTRKSPDKDKEKGTFLLSEIIDLNNLLKPNLEPSYGSDLTATRIKKANSDLEHIRVKNMRECSQVYESDNDLGGSKK